MADEIIFPDGFVDINRTLVADDKILVSDSTDGKDKWAKISRLPAASGFEPANANIQEHIASTSNPHAVDSNDVGLGAVNNTSDADKPISTATQTALNLKAPIANPTFTGVVTVPGVIKGNAVTYLDIYNDTSDGADNKITRIGGGGDVSPSRGAFIALYGNEAPTNPADILLTPGTGGKIVPGGNINLGALKILTTNFSIEETGGELVIKYGSTVIVTISSTGEISAKDFILT